MAESITIILVYLFIFVRKAKGMIIYLRYILPFYNDEHDN